jgi:Spy/CpxP family protein refolding chaperone
MRIVIALAATALFALSLSSPIALAQGMGQGGGQGMGQGMGKGRHQADSQKSDSKAVKADEQAYKDALKRIPDKKSDPWGNMR